MALRRRTAVSSCRDECSDRAARGAPSRAHRVELVVWRSGLRLIDRHPARAATHEPRVDEIELPGWAVALERPPNDKEIAEILDDGVRQVFR
jgi:hypothetical protein